ncbi:MAG: hypothetical protein EBU28_07425 [Gammaproteobacteria bacterium]|nr:hypothetical protein [Gammaproteobacteria bacterium]
MVRLNIRLICFDMSESRCVRRHKIDAVAHEFLDGFPGHVLYAVKCNPEPHMLDALYAAGVRHFDTASLAEVALVSDRLPDARCYFMHPVKSREAIESAHRNYGVSHYVVDHSTELEKIADVITPSRETVIVVRLAIHYAGAVYELSSKFGAAVSKRGYCSCTRRACQGLQLRRGLSCGLAVS